LLMDHLRSHFPILSHGMQGHQLCYLDNASTSQKPFQVIDSLVDFYSKNNANIHRGIYDLAEHATMLYEQARDKVAAFIGADHDEIIFTKGTTEGINFIADSWAIRQLKAGDEIVTTELEHHANFLPWQRITERVGAQLRVIPVTQDGLLDMNQLDSLINHKTKLVALSHVSNALGTHVDVVSIIKKAHAIGALVLVDAAQSAPHQRIDVHAMNADFLVFSGHKMLGPTGIGVLYIKKELHARVDPYQLGGGMVFSVNVKQATWAKSPQKFEAGTPPIAQAVGLGSAIDYLMAHIDFEKLRIHEATLCTRLIDGLSLHKQVRILGPQEQLKKQGHMVSFTIDGYHAHDVAALLSEDGICVRAGHHCAQPLALKMEIDASVRASFYLYNTHEEVDRLLAAIDELIRSA
jgi:cysteine desulfurase / selenocysteine lyase